MTKNLDHSVVLSLLCDTFLTPYSVTIPWEPTRTSRGKSICIWNGRLPCLDLDSVLEGSLLGRQREGREDKSRKNMQPSLYWLKAFWKFHVYGQTEL